ncbi:MAG: fibronectin type III domain-containing protein [bacterium]
MIRAPRFRILLLVGGLLGFTISSIGSCGKDDGSPEGPDGVIGEQPDTIAPAAVTDLRLRYPSLGSVALVWTAPGDDGQKGKATRYIIRYSNSQITEDDWDGATPIDSTSIPAPNPAGRVETIVVTGLDSGTEYFFALKAADEVPNLSPLSNCASGFTLSEKIPPADVEDLRARALDDSSFELTWTAPGDDGTTGTAAAYDIRYSTGPIGDETGWYKASRADTSPTPQPAGSTETFVLTGLQPGTSYFFALKTADESQNWSGISNTVPALCAGEDFWISPETIEAGGLVYLLFRLHTDDHLDVYLFDDSGWVDCDRGDLVLKVLARGDFAAGTYAITYDFFDDSAGSYLGEGYYIFLVCRGTESLFRDFVHFVR